MVVFRINEVRFYYIIFEKDYGDVLIDIWLKILQEGRKFLVKFFVLEIFYKDYGNYLVLRVWVRF